jgi:hypothetical protein
MAIKKRLPNEDREAISLTPDVTLRGILSGFVHYQLEARSNEAQRT